MLMPRTPFQRARQAEQARARVAGLRPRRHGADLEEAEAQAGERIDVRCVLVQARSKTYGIGELEPHGQHGARRNCI